MKMTSSQREERKSNRQENAREIYLVRGLLTLILTFRGLKLPLLTLISFKNREFASRTSLGFHIDGYRCCINVVNHVSLVTVITNVNRDVVRGKY